MERRAGYDHQSRQFDSGVRTKDITLEAERGIQKRNGAGPLIDHQCLRVCNVVSVTGVNGEGYHDLFQTSYIIKSFLCKAVQTSVLPKLPCPDNQGADDLNLCAAITSLDTH